MELSLGLEKEVGVENGVGVVYKGVGVGVNDGANPVKTTRFS